MATLPATTAPDEKFIPPNLGDSGRVGCLVEGSDVNHEYADTKVFAQYVGDGKPDYIAVMSRRNDLKQLYLDCSKWFRDMAEESHK